MHCVRVVSFVETLGFKLLRLLVVASSGCGPFPVHPSILLFSSQVKKESACSCLWCSDAKIGLPKTLRLFLRCAVARHPLSFSCRKQGKKGMHDTRCINGLGLFLTRRRAVQTLRVVFVFLFASAYT